jgi:hypothetical protein
MVITSLKYLWFGYESGQVFKDNVFNSAIYYCGSWKVEIWFRKKRNKTKRTETKRYRMKELTKKSFKIRVRNDGNAQYMPIFQRKWNNNKNPLYQKKITILTMEFLNKLRYFPINSISNCSRLDLVWRLLSFQVNYSKSH